MKPLSFDTKPLAQVGAVLALAASAVAFTPSLLAATAAGTEIKNLATVTYEDSAGNVYSAQSNEAVVTVAQIYSATIGSDLDVNAAPGQQVYLPYVLENTGNGADNFSLSAVNGITDGDNLDSSSITVYHDVNGNGQPDAGELEVSSLALQAGELANLVVAVQVPVSATGGQTLGVTLTAQAEEGSGTAVVGSVTDLSTNGGRDEKDDTNESLITVTDDAVLVVTKSSSHDVANNLITYTVTVKNNGSAAAENVVIFDGFPENTSYVSSQVFGLLDGLTGNSDTLDTVGPFDENVILFDVNGDGDTTDASEADIGIDLNTDGDTGDVSVQGVYAIDAELAPNATVSLTFTVSYNPALLNGGDQINNIAHAAGDLDGDNVTDAHVDSNQVTDTVNQTFGVVIADTGVGSNAGVNDGGDDDGANNDQLVDTISAGGVVLFTNIVTNTGNGDDVFELTADIGNFPAGTVFTFWDETGSVQLNDTNSDTGVDTGIIQSGAALTILVKASLPGGVSGDDNGNEFQAEVTATSAGDPLSVSDSVFESLTIITEAVADIHNLADGQIGSNENPLGAPDYSPVQTVTSVAGTTVNMPLFIDNEGGSSATYFLGVGSGWNGSVLGGLPAGWSVEFFAVDNLGNPVGPAITSTPALPAGKVDHPVVAVITIPADISQTVADYGSDNDVDNLVEFVDGNNDLDGDYPLFFTITSTSTGAFDITMNAVDVEVDDSRVLSLTPTSSNQVEAGGTVSYLHTLANNGNTSEVVEMSSINSLPGWTNAILIDTDGDGIADTELGNLVAGTDITVQQANGIDVTVSVADVDIDGNPELTIPLGAAIPLQASVFAPATASVGQVDVLTINATNVDVDPAAPSVTAVDQTTVVDGQVRLTKLVAVDADCNSEHEGSFAAVQTTEVEPGQCAIWQVTAENQGTTDALNVTITDSVTAFTTYVASSMQYCLGLDCTPIGKTDLPNDDEAALVGGNVVFYAGVNPPAAGQGGTLLPGQIAIVRFTVKVD